MPLPLLIGAAILAGGYGVKKGVDAKKDYSRAEDLNSEAESIYNEAKKKLERERKQAKLAMEQLGKLKFNIYQDQIIPFVDAYTQIKNLELKSQGLTENKLNDVNKDQLQELKNNAYEMKDVVNDGLAALGSGGLAGMAAYGGVGYLGVASTGTAISGLSGVAATNATLAWLGGGSLASGGLGMAGGAAVLGGVVAGPVLAVGGMIMASKAEEAKHNAYANYDKAELAAEEMKLAGTTTKAIKTRFIEAGELLTNLVTNFTPLLERLQSLIKEETNYSKFTKQQQRDIYKAFQLAVTIKNILEAPLLTKKGTPNKNTTKLLKSIKEKL